MIAASRSPWNARLLWFALPGLLGSGAWWWGIKQFITGQVDLAQHPVASIGIPAVVGILGLGVWLGSASLSNYLSPWRSIRAAAAILFAIPVFIFFPISLWTGVAALTIAVGLFINSEQVAIDVHNRMVVQPLATLNQNLSVAITTLMLAAAILSYQQITRQATSSTATTQRLSSQLVTATEQFLPNIYPAYRPDISVDDFIASQLPSADKILDDINFSQLTNQAAQQQALNDKLRELGLDPNQAHVDVKQGAAALRLQLASQLEKFRRDAIAQTREQVGKQFGLTLTGRETMHEVLTQFVTNRLTTSLGRLTTYLPIILAAGVFLLLRLFSFLYTWAIVGWGWLWFSALRLMNVVKITTMTVPAQRAEWH